MMARGERGEGFLPLRANPMPMSAGKVAGGGEGRAKAVMERSTGRQAGRQAGR